VSRVVVTGLWLRKDAGNRGALEVLLEIDGQWRKAIAETADDGPISHIVEPAGILTAPLDDLPEVTP
jgi:hypothetical protein